MRPALFLAAVSSLVLTACPGPEEVREGPTLGDSFYIYWAPVPDPIPFNEPFQLAIMTHDGEDPSVMLSDTELSVDAQMPAHGHGMNTVPLTTANGDGSFLTEGMLFHMPGAWQIDMIVSQGEIEDAVSFEVICCN